MIAPLPDDVDVVVIGAGPAGTLLASLVQRESPGHRVLVLEKDVFPRHHVGESTIPSWHSILERAGVLRHLEAAGFMLKVGTLFEWGAADDERWTIDFRDKVTGGARPGSFQVDRATFDRVLLAHARSLGAQVLEGATVEAAERTPAGFVVRWKQEGEHHRVRTRYLVDASGQARVLSRLWGLRLVPFDEMNNVAIYGYWKGSAVAQFGREERRDRERWTYISTSPDGWVWHIPTFPDLVSVGLVTDADSIRAGGQEALEEVYVRNVRAAGGIAPLLSAAELVRHPLARARTLVVRDWAYRVAEACGPGWFLVGDAAAFVDPILSSGLLIAANGASLAANALHTLWMDPAVDLPLLLRSYKATYDDMAESYHRMARVWYTRNFKYPTWHWEAKRQRLRTGAHPARETDAAAFKQLCAGSFANPVEGMFATRGLVGDLHRTDARIYASHLFRDEAGVQPADREPEDEDAARAQVEAEARARWIHLLSCRLEPHGFDARVREGYFTDGTMREWKHVRYMELRPKASADEFDRVVFSLAPELPDGVMPHLTPDRPLRDILRALGSSCPVGSPQYRLLLGLLEQQILQLDMRGWLRVTEAADPGVGRAEWPTFLLAALDRLPHARAEVDLLGGSIALRLSPHGSSDPHEVVLMPSARADATTIWKKTRTTAVSYSGDVALVGPAASGLLRTIASWEAAEPEAASQLWDRDVPRLAGRAIGG